MSEPYVLRIVLRSGATFGRGVRTPSVDVETDRDPDTGLPFVRKSVVRGLIVEGCADVLYALRERGLPSTAYEPLREAAGRLFGRPGSRAECEGALTVGRAELPDAYRRAVAAAVAKDADGSLVRGEALAAHATVRWSTANDAETESAAEGTLRSSRVVHRETAFRAPLDPGVNLHTAGEGTAGGRVERAVLGAAVAAVRRAGWRRSRGRGRLHRIEVRRGEGGDDLVGGWLNDFEDLITNRP
ncbi:MAG: hypothetical protein AAGI91_15315 [Bacteroidota bacterium]